MEAVRERLNALGARESRPRVFEQNIVLDTAESSLRKKGELLRLRSAGDDRVLTYKGRGEPGKHKSREEIEISFDHADKLQLIFERLGYKVSFRYEKYRTEFQWDGGTITLDETPVGQFLELEGTPEWIDRTAAELGFQESDYLTGSYAELYRDFCQKQGRPVRHMVFGDAWS